MVNMPFPSIYPSLEPLFFYIHFEKYFPTKDLKESLPKTKCIYH